MGKYAKGNFYLKKYFYTRCTIYYRKLCFSLGMFHFPKKLLKKYGYIISALYGELEQAITHHFMEILFYKFILENLGIALTGIFCNAILWMQKTWHKADMKKRLEEARNKGRAELPQRAAKHHQHHRIKRGRIII